MRHDYCAAMHLPEHLTAEPFEQFTNRRPHEGFTVFGHDARVFRVRLKKQNVIGVNQPRHIADRRANPLQMWLRFALFQQ